ncbi:MAG: hypothetical protein WA154_12865 [Moraxellaceae bacterium]
MAKFPKHIVDMWAANCASYLKRNSRNGATLADVTTGAGAWEVAHRAGVVNDAYSDSTVTDGHIQTALAAIFPNAIFKDAKRY